MQKSLILTTAIAAALLAGCKTSLPGPKATFGEDVAFLQKHVAVHLLKSSTGGQVAVIPDWQGRVITSSATGATGFSQGWVNYPLIEAGIKPEAERKGLESHIYVLGGEERLWLGPEGGQYALFFAPGVKDYTFEKWKTPALIDTEAFNIIKATDSKITMEKSATLTNNSGTTFKLRLEREVQVLENAEIAKNLNVSVPASVRFVGYQTRNVLTNAGDQAWTQDGGLMSVWMLCMLKHGPEVTIVLPLADGPEPAVNTDYFGAVERDRLRIIGKTVFFKADGQFRAKIGIPPLRAKGICGSYDAQRGILTVLTYNQPKDAATLPYVRAQWKHHDQPYAGDVINAYNDGSPEPGAKPLGPFYEIESSSPALPLQPGQTITHIQSMVHFAGTPEQLDPIAKATLGVSLEEIKNSLK
jgi:hypothetical protein